MVFRRSLPPLNLDLCIPEDDSLRLLIEITEEMDYRELYAADERRESAGEATAKQLFQLVVFGFMNGYYSLRSISAACRYDVRMQNVFTEVLLYAFALNIKKLHTKMGEEILGVILHQLEAS
ncbi:MAG: hypothetical protein IJ337_08490 [Clostridia bacterium]|nr:hypothetical protein [Clostridia bacterium]